MSLIIPPGFAQAVMRHDYSFDPEPMVCTFGVDISDAVGTDEDTADWVAGAWSSFIPSIATVDLVFVGCTLYIGQDGGPPLVVDSAVVSVDGDQGTSALPPNSAAMFRKRTDTAGRRGRGRFYVPAVPRGAVDDNGNLDSEVIDQYQTAASALLADLADTGGPAGPTPMVVLHRSEGLGPEPVPTPVTQLTADGRIATQRRRLRP